MAYDMPVAVIELQLDLTADVVFLQDELYLSVIDRHFDRTIIHFYQHVHYFR
jgi:hypothetical protein